MAETCAVNVRTAADIDRVDNLSIAALWYVSGNLKLTVEYDHLAEQEKGTASNQKDNDQVIVQLQAKF